MTITDLQVESALNIEGLLKFQDELHPRVQASLTKHRNQARDTRPRGELPNFAKSGYVLVARSHFHSGEKLCLRWGVLRRVPKALSGNVFHAEDPRNDQLNHVRVSRFKLFRDSATDKPAIISHVLQSEADMAVSPLLGIEGISDGLFVRVR